MEIVYNWLNIYNILYVLAQILPDCHHQIQTPFRASLWQQSTHRHPVRHSSTQMSSRASFIEQPNPVVATHSRLQQPYHHWPYRKSILHPIPTSRSHTPNHKTNRSRSVGDRRTCRLQKENPLQSTNSAPFPYGSARRDASLSMWFNLFHRRTLSKMQNASTQSRIHRSGQLIAHDFAGWFGILHVHVLRQIRRQIQSPMTQLISESDSFQFRIVWKVKFNSPENSNFVSSTDKTEIYTIKDKPTLQHMNVLIKIYTTCS